MGVPLKGMPTHQIKKTDRVGWLKVELKIEKVRQLVAFYGCHDHEMI
jgi:hypothetical protein